MFLWITPDVVRLPVAHWSGAGAGAAGGPREAHVTWHTDEVATGLTTQRRLGIPRRASPAAPPSWRTRLQQLRQLRQLRQGEAWRDETGDVPGWVLITLMTAGLVVVIWALAGPALTQLFESAIGRVAGL